MLGYELFENVHGLFVLLRVITHPIKVIHMLGRKLRNKFSFIEVDP